jgi:hypothetical protein
MMINSVIHKISPKIHHILIMAIALVLFTSGAEAATVSATSFPTLSINSDRVATDQYIFTFDPEILAQQQITAAKAANELMEIYGGTVRFVYNSGTFQGFSAIISQEAAQEIATLPYVVSISANLHVSTAEIQYGLPSEELNYIGSHDISASVHDYHYPTGPTIHLIN